MIIILGLVGFVGLILAFIRLMPDFSSFVWVKSRPSRLKPEWQDMGTIAVTIFFTLIIAITGLLFYKFCIALVAYFLSDTFISFFVLLRGVFTIVNESQNPFVFKHLFSGWLVAPAIQFLAIYLIFSGIRKFMTEINKKYPSPVSYKESDAFYFGFLAAIIFAMLDFVSYTQSIPTVSQIAHLTFLGLSKISIVLFYLSITHVNLLNLEEYRDSILDYVQMKPLVQKVVFSPSLIILTTYCVGLALNFPFFTGTQFLENNWMIVFILLIACTGSYLLLRLFLAKGFNFLGVVMLEKVPSELGPNIEIVKPEKEKNFYYVVGLVAVLFMLLKFKLFFFFGTLLFVAVSVLLFTLTLTYLLGLCASFIRVKIYNFSSRKISIRPIVTYLYYAGKSYLQGVALMLGGIFLVFSILTFFPKPIDFTNEEFVNYVVDADGNLIFSEYSNSNPSFPISYSELPPFLVKCLITQEDRSFRKQGDWFPNLSNWQGFSFALFYRFLTGGGGSNLNQQLVKNMAFKGNAPQDIQRKLSESLSGYLMSIQSDPKEILTAYMNIVSFCGGRGHSGVVHASYRNFGRHISDLNNLEMLYLVATIKRGANFRTKEFAVEFDEAAYYTAEIKDTLIGLAQVWVRQGLWSKNEINKLKIQELRFTDGTIPSNLHTSSKEFIRHSIKGINSKEKGIYYSPILFEKQEKINTAIREYEMKFQSYLDVNNYRLYTSALVVDVKKGHIVGHYGGNGITDLTTMGTGNPIGSVIKPFLLIELLEEQGLDFEDVRLYDGKMEGKYTPNNANGRYSNQYVDIRTILGRSQNAPMVNIREYVNPIDIISSVEDKFSEMGISSDPYLDLNNQSKYGEIEINYPMGSRNMTLLEVAQIYQVLFNGGEYIELTPISIYSDSSGEIPLLQRKKRVYQPSNADAITSALSYSLHPGGTAVSLKSSLPPERTYYAKTGTTDKAKHGYTVLSDGETLIVTWTSYCRESNNHLDCNNSPSIPYGSGARSAGVLATMIYRNLQ